jgi:glyoxylase-like metal-dependent hydrolase (beta-lactamase superfamily II)
MRRIAQGLEFVDPAIERGIVGCVVVGEHEAPAGSQYAGHLSERARNVREVVRRETAHDPVERRVEEGERFRGRDHEGHVRDALPRHQRAGTLEHPRRRVRADGDTNLGRDTPQRVTDAAAEIEHDVFGPRVEERDQLREVLALRMHRGLEVRLRSRTELPLHRSDALLVHFSILTLVRVGRFQVEIFSDGIFRLDGGAMFGIVPKALWEKEKPADDRNRIAMDMNCLLIRDGVGNVVVVETGAGPKLTERSKQNFGIDGPPRLLDELARRGVRPDEVTLVVNTHLHFDHAGGNTYRDGDRVVATFPRASYVFQRLEWVDANAPNERTRGSYFAEDYAPLEATGKLELIDESVEILPGIRLDRLPGHTRGTQSVRVSDSGETLFFSSDFMPDRHHLRLPWIPAFDLFPLETLAAKKVILPRAVSEGWLVGFTHDVPRFGRILEQDGKLRFEEVTE